MSPIEQLHDTKDDYERGAPWLTYSDIALILGLLALVGAVVLGIRI